MWVWKCEWKAKRENVQAWCRGGNMVRSSALISIEQHKPPLQEKNTFNLPCTLKSFTPMIHYYSLEWSRQVTGLLASVKIVQSLKSAAWCPTVISNSLYSLYTAFWTFLHLLCFYFQSFMDLDPKISKTPTVLLIVWFIYLILFCCWLDLMSCFTSNKNMLCLRPLVEKARYNTSQTGLCW